MTVNGADEDVDLDSMWGYDPPTCGGLTLRGECWVFIEHPASARVYVEVTCRDTKPEFICADHLRQLIAGEIGCHTHDMAHAVVYRGHC